MSFNARFHEVAAEVRKYRRRLVSFFGAVGVDYRGK